MSTLAPTPTLGVGLHDDVPAKVYHSDPCESPSLSSSLACTLHYHSPAHAWLQHPRLNPNHEASESTSAMTQGTLVHALLSNEADSVVIGQFDSYRTAAAREWRDSVAATGKTPVLEKDTEGAQEIADAIRRHAAAGYDNDPFRLKPGVTARSEVTGIWQEGNAWFRLRADLLVLDPAGYADLWDWKVTADISDRAIERRIADMHYAFKQAFYLRGLRQLLPQYRGRMTNALVFVENSKPYTVRRVFLSEAYMHHADREVSRACDLWAQCMATGDWSDPRNGLPTTIELPGWLVEDDAITIE